MSDYPSGTVTLLFTDIEGSTLLLQRLGERYREALGTHRRLLREAVADADGREIDTQGDSFFIAFQRARDALAAAANAQRRLAHAEWPEGGEVRVRMGLHTGEPAIGDEGYLGLDVHRAARICAAAHGGQIVLSQTTRELSYDVLPPDAEVEDLGEHRLKDLPRAEHLYQLVVPGLRSAFPPLKDVDSQAAASSPFLGRERELGAKAMRAVSAAASRVVGSISSRGRVRRRGFADFGWEVRALLPAAPAEFRDLLSALGGDLFALGRTDADYERYLHAVDRTLLDARLREYDEEAVLSRRAAAEAEALRKRLKHFSELVDLRRATDEVAAEVEAIVRRLRRADTARADSLRADIDALRARVQRTERNLDDKLADVRDALGDVGIALKRTRHRGVFRVGSRYVVPFFDEVGIEQRRQFSSLDEAYAFRRSLRLTGADSGEAWESGVTGTRQWGGEQGLIPPRRGPR